MIYRAALVVLLGLALISPAASQPSAPPYVIGVSIPLTGPLGSSGVQWLPGMQIAVEDINRAGGVNGHPLKLVVEDSLGTPPGGISSMRKLVEVDGAQAVISTFSNVVGAQVPLATQLKVALVTGVQTPHLMSNSPYTFSHTEAVPQHAQLYQNYWKKLHVKRIYAFVPNNAIGPVYSAILRDAATGAGAEYAESSFTYGENDYRGLVARAKDYNPDTVVVAGQGGIDDTVIIRQLRESGITVPIDVTGQFYVEPAWRAGVGSYIDGITLAGVTIDPKAGKAFIEQFRRRTGQEPEETAALMYDMVQMIAVAIAKGGYSGTAIANQLAVMKGVPSLVGGTIAMDAEHESRPTTDALWHVRDGKLVRIAP